MKKILLIVIVLFLVVGCKKNNQPNNTDNTTSNNTPNEVTPVKIETKQLDFFDEMINNIIFTSEVAGTTDNNLSVVFTGLRELKATISGDKEINYTINYEEDVKGVSIAYQENEGYIYVLTQNNHVYYSKVTPTENTNPQKFNIENVDSFCALYTDLSASENFQAVVIMKTTEGKYYTDYSFDNTNRALIEITK